jgi:hypothetical protein
MYGMISDKFVGPYFYDGVLNGRQYLNCITNKLPILLVDVL